MFIKKPETIKELSEFIWYLEEKYDLLNLEIDGVKIWQYLRMEIYYKLAQDLNILAAQNKSSKTFSMVFSNLFNLMKNSLFYNPFWNKKEVENIVFSHNRSKYIDNEYIDIYTKHLIDDLEKNNKTYISFEKPFHNKHIRKKDSNTFYLDLIISLSIIYGKFYKVKKWNSIVTTIENEIKNITGVKFPLIKLFQKNIGRFKVGHKLYKYLFKKIKPKNIYLVVGYSYLGDMIKAGKELGINTIELQHGVVSKYHLGYSYPNKVNLEYAPNQFYSWGNFWQKSIENMFEKENIINYGFQHFNNIKSNYNHVKKVSNKIIVISQAVLSKELMEELLKIIDELSEYEISYKLHPEEYSLYKDYNVYKQLNQYKNITFLENVDLYQELAESTFQMGVFSTALYEGIAFGCKTIIFNLPGIEYIVDEFNRNEIEIFVSDIKHNLKDSKFISRNVFK